MTYYYFCSVFYSVVYGIVILWSRYRCRVIKLIFDPCADINYVNFRFFGYSNVYIVLISIIGFCMHLTVTMK